MSGKRITELQQSTTLKNDSLLLVTTGSENGNLTRAITLEQFKNSICADYNTDGDVSELFYSAAKIDEILSENEENYQNWHNEHTSISEEVATNKANINANLSKIKSNTNLINLIYNEQEQELIKDSSKTLYTYFNDKAKSLNADIDKIWTLMVGSSIKYSLENDGIFIRDPRGKDIGTFDTAYGALNNRITALENAIGSSNEWNELVETGFDTAEGDPYTRYKTLKEKITEEINTVDKRVEMTVGKSQQNLSVVFGETVSEFEKREFTDNNRKYYKHYLGNSYGYTIDGKMYPMIIDYQNSHHTEGNNWVNRSNITGRGTTDWYGITELSMLQLTIGAQIEDLRQHGLGHYNFNTESSFTTIEYQDETEGEYWLNDSNSTFHLSNGKYIPLVPHINPIRVGSEKHEILGYTRDVDTLDFSYIDRINLTAGKRFNELEKSTSKIEEKIDKNDDINQKMDLLITESLYRSAGTDNYEPADPNLIYNTYRVLNTTDKNLDTLFGKDDNNNKRWYTSSSGGFYIHIDPSDIESDKRDISIRKDIRPSIDVNSGISSITKSYLNASATRIGCKYYLDKLNGKSIDYKVPQDNDEWYALTQESIIDAAVGALRKDVDYLYQIVSGKVGDYCSFYGVGYNPSNSDPYNGGTHMPYIELTENNSYAIFNHMYTPAYTDNLGNNWPASTYGVQGLAIRKDKFNMNYKFISFRIEPSAGSFNTQFPDTIFKYSISDLYEAGKQCYVNKKDDVYVYLTKTIPGDILNIKTGENSMLMITLGARMANLNDIGGTKINTKEFTLTGINGNVITTTYNNTENSNDYYCFKLDLKLYIHCIVDQTGYSCYTSKELPTLRQKYWLKDVKIMC